jgi:diadenosine tetraphosphatase ApaH/serine/threonine PP2A family protein phosphatase
VPDLILSDIHGNWEALAAVLAHARGCFGRILCLGDLVGYGADPNAVVKWARANVAAIVRGNHDRTCIGLGPLDGYNPAARSSAIWTRAALTPESSEYLERLPPGPLRVDDFDLVHGSPLDEDEYLITLGDVAQIRSYLDTPLSFFGHTHLQGGFLVARGGVGWIDPGRVLELEPDHSYLVNPGSVGQPRDGDPRAAYALYSSGERAIEFRRAEYDIAGAAAKIRAAGLPEALALRLHEGV